VAAQDVEAIHTAVAAYDVEADAATPLGDIETQIQAAIDAAAAFGSAEKRLDIQASFVGKLVDSMTSGIGALVDADMEAASARLNALVVQQQLGLQALSIANSNSQGLLSLFR
jgi:flagellin